MLKGGVLHNLQEFIGYLPSEIPSWSEYYSGRYNELTELK